MSRIKSVGRKLLTPFLGRRRLQPFFEALHDVSMAGLNMGEGASPLSSGEVTAIRHVRDNFSRQQDPIVVFDVGANIGQFADVLLREFATCPTALDAWLFEPSPKTFQKLRSNLDGRAGVRLQNLGLGDQVGERRLYSIGEGSKFASLYRRDMPHKNETMDCVEIAAISTVDYFCFENGIKHIQFLKLDVEGHEFKVLQGATDMLAQGCIDFIQFEFGGANIDSRTYFKDFYLLLNTDYQLYRILQDGIWPIREYRESFEVFKRATNYLAQRRAVRFPYRSLRFSEKNLHVAGY